MKQGGTAETKAQKVTRASVEARIARDIGERLSDAIGDVAGRVEAA
jgi:hypothetical protein